MPSKLKARDVSLLRSLISSAYSNPGILGHDDLQSFRDFLYNLGARLDLSDASIDFDIENRRPACPPPALRPEIPNNASPEIIFGAIVECEYDPWTRIITMKRYTLGHHVIKAVNSLLKLLKKSSKSLVSRDYTFLYDFLIYCGVAHVSIMEYIEVATAARAKEKRQKKKLKEVDAAIVDRSYQPLELEEEKELDSGITACIPVEQEEEKAVEPYHEENPEKRQKAELMSKSRSGELSQVQEKVEETKSGEGFMFQCPACTLAFAWRSGMLRHFRKKHPGQTVPLPTSPNTKIKCQYCPKVFPANDSLRRHVILRHPMQSELSSRKFNSQTSQTSSDKPGPNTSVEMPKVTKRIYRCTKCNYELQSRNGLKYHWSKFHPGLKMEVLPFNDNIVRNVKCSLCTCRFVTRSGLRYHMKTKHKQPVVSTSQQP